MNHAPDLQLLGAGYDLLRAGKPAESIAKFDAVIAAYEAERGAAQVRCADSLEQAILLSAVLMAEPGLDQTTILGGNWCSALFAKGYALVLMVEILAAAMAGANFGFEASTFFDAAGPPPGVGQVLLAIDPGPLSGGTFGSRLSLLIDAIDAEPGARLPGTRRSATRVAAQRSGLEIDDRLLDRIAGLIPG